LIVLDASVLIAHFDAGDPHHEKARRLLKKYNGEQLGASAITLAETLVSPARAGRLVDAEAALDRLGVVELVLDEGSPGLLAAMRTESGMKLPDCCVLLAARDHDAAVASFDKRLLAAAKKLNLRRA
jgi:predicted nucleic acid-binding protein